MERVITVSGKGVKRVSPDTIEINFTVKALDASYDNMLKLSEEQLIAMQNVVERAGFEKNSSERKITEYIRYIVMSKKKTVSMKTFFQDMNASRIFC